MEKRYIVAAADDHEDGCDCAGMRSSGGLQETAHDARVNCYRSSTSAGAIAGSRSALALSRRGSFTLGQRRGAGPQVGRAAGQLRRDHAIVVFSTDNGPQTQTFPDGGVTPFKANKLTTWEGGMRVPLVMRWPGVIRPGTLKTEIFASLDRLPTFVEIAGGPKGNDLNKQIQEGSHPGIVKTKLDGVNQVDYLTGKSEKSARDTFFYYTGATPSAVRYKNWKIYFTMEGSSGASALMGPQQYGWAQVQNIRSGLRGIEWVIIRQF